MRTMLLAATAAFSIISAAQAEPLMTSKDFTVWKANTFGETIVQARNPANRIVIARFLAWEGCHVSVPVKYFFIDGKNVLLDPVGGWGKGPQTCDELDNSVKKF